MYQLTSAIAKPLNGNGHWISVDIGDVAINVLFSTYSRIWAILTNSFLTAPVALDLAQIRSQVGGESITFSQFLTANGNATLPTTNQIPAIKPRYAKYVDAFQAGYTVQPIHATAAPDAQLPAADLTWLYMTRPDTDYSTFYKSCLVNVNGYFHATDAGPNGVYVKDGMTTARISRENQLGILSFANLGSLSFVPITADMVYKQNDRENYKDRAYVDIGQDVSDKTVMLVLGGYLHVLDRKTFYRVGASMFAIDFGNLPFLDRYFESKKYIDLSSLPLSSTPRNDGQISTTEFFSDANILAYLTLSQSFFVILDNADIFAELSALPKTVLPNVYTSYEKPIWPVILSSGRLANYWPISEEGQYSLLCRNAFIPHPLYDTIDPRKVSSVSNQCDPGNANEIARAYFLKVGSDLA